MKDIVEKTINKILLMRSDRNEGNEYGFEIYIDYNDEPFPLDKVFNDNHPKETYMDIISEAEAYYDSSEEIKYYTKEVIDELVKLNIPEADYDNEEVEDYVREHIYFYYPESYLNQTVKTIIMLDTGNANQDFDCDNILNWDGQFYSQISKESSVMWFAKQQRKKTSLLKAIHKYKSTGIYPDKNSFEESCIQELENLPSCMGSMTFIVKMKLYDIFDILEKNVKTVTLSKDTMCGLYNPWSGAGSVLEIQPVKDIVIPIDKIWDIWPDGTKKHGYDVDEVYGLCGWCWKDSVKNIA